MIIVALSDIHGDTSQLGRLADDLIAADVVVLAGDLTHFGHGDAAARVVREVRQYSSLVLGVHGNCDHPDVVTYLGANNLSLHAAHYVVSGLELLGVGGSLPCPGTTPSEFTEDELATFLAEAERDLPTEMPRVLVSHQPPLNTVTDLASIGRHVGSRSVREFIERAQPLVCLTGHIHEGRGIDRIGDTWVVKPGPLRRGGYVYASIDAAGGLAEVEIR